MTEHKMNQEELETENKELRKQVAFWRGLYSSEQKMHINGNDFCLRIMENQQRIIDDQKKTIEKLRQRIRRKYCTLCQAGFAEHFPPDEAEPRHKRG